jgi:hypothetical protein
MKPTWWEKPVCWLCDYWWVLLIATLILITAYLMRSFWLPLLGISDGQPTQTITNITPDSSPTTTLVEITNTSIFTTTVSPELTVTATSSEDSLSGYINEGGGYGFNYPSGWKGTETKSNVNFIADDYKIDIEVFSPQEEMTLSDISSASGPMPSSPDEFSQTTIAGVPALQHDLSIVDGQICGRAYHILYNGLHYIITITSGSYELSESEPIYNQFEALVNSFRFISE